MSDCESLPRFSIHSSQGIISHSLKRCQAGLESACGHQNFLKSDARRGRFVCDKGQLQVVEDAVDDGIVGDEGDDAPVFPVYEKCDLFLGVERDFPLFAFGNIFCW